MINRPPEDPAREAFLQELRDFYTTSGSPPYKELAKISLRLEELYPLDGDSRRGLPSLSPSGISEVLGGRRKKLPTAGWLSAFVLSCQRRAWQIGALDGDPGASTLPTWQRRLREAQAKSNSAGTERPAGEPNDLPAQQPGPAAPHPDSGPATPGPPRPHSDDPGVDRTDGRTNGRTDHRPDEPPGPPPDQPPDPTAGPPRGPSAAFSPGRGLAGSGAPARSMVALGTVRTPVIDVEVARSAVPVRLPPQLREYVAGYGRYGSRLLAEAQAREMDAVYRVAVLLLGAESVDGDAEAKRLLVYAGAAGHREALGLMDAKPGRLDRLEAAGHAYELAEAAADDDDWPAAMAFYESAARCGLPAASVKLADALLIEGEGRQAIQWLALAAHQGDTMAEIRLEELRRAGRIPPTYRIRAPTPAADVFRDNAPTDN